GAIAPQVEQAEIERARIKPTANLDAYDYYLRGTAALAGFSGSTKEGTELALKNYMAAIELDPSFSAAYGWAAIAYARRKQGLWMSDANAERAEGIRLARKAIVVG